MHLQGFWPKTVYLKCFGIQLKTVYLQGPCSSRPCISRPCCTRSRSAMKKMWYSHLFYTHVTNICLTKMFRFLNQCFARLRFWKSVSSKTAVAPSSRFCEFETLFQNRSCAKHWFKKLKPLVQIFFDHVQIFLTVFNFFWMCSIFFECVQIFLTWLNYVNL